MSVKTRISCNVDFDRDGKQHGHMFVPNSRDTSGWGTLCMPITCIRNGDGPSVLFTGGNHGDEYEGPVALMKLMRALKPEEISGRLIIIPGLNYPALLAGKRLSPIDGRNMNRTFPGRYDGTITEAIAHWVYNFVLPEVSLVADLHSGGYSMIMVPSVMVHYLPNEKQMADTVAAMKAFRAPMGIIAEELDTEGMLDTAVENLGKVFLGTELGGGAMLTPESMRVAETGVRNLLKHMDMMDGEPVTPEWRTWGEPKVMEVPDTGCYVMAMADGLYEPFFEVGDFVPPGQAVGQIHFPQQPEREPMVLAPRTGGFLWSRRGPGQIEKGDTAAVIAVESKSWN